MSSVGLFEAKQRLSELVERARKGEVIALTKRGVEVARIIAPRPASADRGEVVRAIRAARLTARLGGLSLRAMIREGRK